MHRFDHPADHLVRVVVLEINYNGLSPNKDTRVFFGSMGFGLIVAGKHIHGYVHQFKNLWRERTQRRIK